MSPSPEPNPNPAPGRPDAVVEGPWYRDGLAFACTRCGACCTGTPGYVWVNVAEIDRLAGHLGLDRDAFGRRYLRRVEGQLSLIEKPNYDCIFWDTTTGCTVYEARPTQCRTWPFWPENVATPADWEGVRRVCPGSGQGPLYSVGQIQEALRQSPD